MSYHVLFQVIFPRKTLRAYYAPKRLLRFLDCICTSLVKSSVTFVTICWWITVFVPIFGIFFCWCWICTSRYLLLMKTHSTHTFVRLLAGMYQHMILHVVFSRKTYSTMWAPVWFFPRYVSCNAPSNYSYAQKLNDRCRIGAFSHHFHTLICQWLLEWTKQLMVFPEQLCMNSCSPRSNQYVSNLDW